MHNIHDINQFLVKIHLYLKCSVKKGYLKYNFKNYKSTQK